MRVLCARPCIERRHRAAPGSAREIWPPCRPPAACACRHSAPSTSRTASSAVSHSGFFRDPEQFDALELRILPRLLEHSTRLRAWSAGCANGLELWSLGIVLSRLGALDSAQLLGSDLLEENLAIARAGTYDVVEITPALRRRARWEQRDLVHDPPPAGRFDLIMCRNVAIYLEPVAKGRLHRTLAGALAPGGVLLLGRSERLGDPEALGLRRLEPHVYGRPR